MPNETSIILKNLCVNAHANVKTRLVAMDKIIHGFKVNHVELTVPNVVNALRSTGVSVSASSLYNKTVRGQPNPYRVLFDAWARDINNAKLDKVSNTTTELSFTSMTNSDFASIGSDIVKFKVQCLSNELKSARHQINMLKQIKNLPLIETDNSHLAFHNHSSQSRNKSSFRDDFKNNELNRYVDIINEFTNKSNKLGYDEDGCLVAKTTIRKGDVLSELDFKVAIDTAIKNLQRFMTT
ncbi:hypothetical protein [Aeromonas hydrophila]|uniref:hypothetical protein n=1 Tax=Aeromonas hydrophila TaxID=644 RepID=UPI00114D0C69|nr:hypothetical protein [Aeromonas hydrophila]